MKVLIVGCGDLGTEAALRFTREGHEVFGLRRSPQKLPAAITPIAATLPNLPDDLPTVDTLVFTIAADERSVEAYRRAYIDAPTAVLDHYEAAGTAPKRVQFVSSTAVYGVDDGSDVTEDTPAEANTDTGRVLREAEVALHARRPDALSLRLAGVYGPGRTFLIDQVRDGRARIPDRAVFTNRIHRDDAAEALVYLATRTTPPPPVLLGVDHESAPRGDVFRFLADELGLPHPPVGAAGPSRGGNKRCRNDRLLATGFSFTYPSFREGYRAVLAGTGIRHP